MSALSLHSDALRQSLGSRVLGRAQLCRTLSSRPTGLQKGSIGAGAMLHPSQKRSLSITPESMSRAGCFDSGLPENADVVIIGGGVTGTALLYELGEFTGE